MTDENKITGVSVYGPEGGRQLHVVVAVSVGGSADRYHVTTDEFAINEQRDGVLTGASCNFKCEGPLTRDMAIWIVGFREGLRIEEIRRQDEKDRVTGVPETKGAPSKLPTRLFQRLRLVKAGLPWDVVCAIEEDDLWSVASQIAEDEREQECCLKPFPLGAPARPAIHLGTFTAADLKAR